jgi:hypothetical protein
LTGNGHSEAGISPLAPTIRRFAMEIAMEFFGLFESPWLRALAILLAFIGIGLLRAAHRCRKF